MNSINTKTICEVCGKCPVSAYNRPHSLHRTKTVKYPNVQKQVQNNKVRYICTRCLRTEAKRK